jgi:hypothetical protein
MNHMIQNVSSAIVQCRRFIAFQVSNLREAVSTLPIIRATRSSQGAENIGSDLRFYIDKVKTSLTYPVLYRLEPLRGLTPGRRSVSRGVAFAIGISMSIPMASADSGSIDAITPKEYVRLALPKKEAVCLSRLIGKESAWNPKAIGNLSSPTKQYVYGLLQLKNPIVKDKSPIEQIHFGLRYIDHRYDGDTCKAWEHWKDKGWH